MSNPAAHIDILRIMTHEGQYDPMEEASQITVMHEFEGSSMAYRWLLDQEDFFIDFFHTCGFTWGHLIIRLLNSNVFETSTYLESVLCRGNLVHVAGDLRLADHAAWSMAFIADNIDFPKRIKLLLDAGVDFHARPTGYTRTALRSVLESALYHTSDAKKKYNICTVEREFIPKPPTGSTRRVIDYDSLDPTLNTKCRPRLSRAMWQTWNTEEELTLEAVRGLSPLKITQRYLDAWMEVLLEAGVDIADYGRQEDQLHPEGIFGGSMGEARVVFEYGSHVSGCRIHVTEVWVFDFDDDDLEEEVESAEAPAMPCSWDFDEE